MHVIVNFIFVSPLYISHRQSHHRHRHRLDCKWILAKQFHSTNYQIQLTVFSYCFIENSRRTNAGQMGNRFCPNSLQKYLWMIYLRQWQCSTKQNELILCEVKSLPRAHAHTNTFDFEMNFANYTMARQLSNYFLRSTRCDAISLDSNQRLNLWTIRTLRFCNFCVFYFLFHSFAIEENMKFRCEKHPSEFVWNIINK